MKHTTVALNRVMRRNNEEQSYLEELSNFLQFTHRQSLKTAPDGQLVYEGLPSKLTFTPFLHGSDRIHVEYDGQAHTVPFIPTYDLASDKARLVQLLKDTVGHFATPAEDLEALDAANQVQNEYLDLLTGALAKAGFGYKVVSPASRDEDAVVEVALFLIQVTLEGSYAVKRLTGEEIYNTSSIPQLIVFLGGQNS